MTLLGRLPICWRLVIMSDDSNSFSANREAKVVSFSQWEDNTDVFWPMRGLDTDNLPSLHHNYSSVRGLKEKSIAFKLYQGIFYSYSFMFIIVNLHHTCAVPEVFHPFTGIVKINLNFMMILAESKSGICQKAENRDGNCHNRDPHLSQNISW